MSVTQPPINIRPNLELRLEFDEGDLRSQLSALANVSKGERKALKRAIDRALLGTRTDITADLRQRTVLRAGDIRKGIAVQTGWWTSHTSCSGYVRVRTGHIPLIRFEVRPLRQTAQKGRRPNQYKPLTYRLTRGGKQFDNTPNTDIPLVSKLFVVKGKGSGKLSVRYRMQGIRLSYPMEEFGPTLQFFVSRETDQARILRGADTRFRKELAHQAHHLGGGGK